MRNRMAEHGNPVSWASSSADLNWHSLTEINIMTCTIGEQRLFVRSGKPFLPQGEGGMQDAAGSDGDGSDGTQCLSTANLHKLKMFSLTHSHQCWSQVFADTQFRIKIPYLPNTIKTSAAHIGANPTEQTTFTCMAGALTNYKLTLQSHFLALGACETGILNEQ